MTMELQNSGKTYATRAPSNTKRNRTLLLLTFGCFVVPVIIAYALHGTGAWQQRGSASKGTLISPPISADSLTLTTPDNKPLERGRHWWLMYIAPASCNAQCTQSLMAIRQTRTASGPEQHRVNNLVVMLENSDNTASHWVTQHGEPTTLENAPQTMFIASGKQQQFQSHQLQPGSTYLIDPMGAIFMHYAPGNSEAESIQRGKDILRDLKRVLKLSRIG